MISTPIDIICPCCNKGIQVTVQINYTAPTLEVQKTMQNQKEVSTVHMKSSCQSWTLCGSNKPLSSMTDKWENVTCDSCHNINFLVTGTDRKKINGDKQDKPKSGLVQMPSCSVYLTEVVGLTEDQAKVIVEVINLFKGRSEEKPPTTETHPKYKWLGEDVNLSEWYRAIKKSLEGSDRYIIHHPTIYTVSSREVGGVDSCEYCRGTGYVNCEWSSHPSTCPVCEGSTVERAKPSTSTPPAKEDIPCTHQFTPIENIHIGQTSIQCKCRKCGMVTVIELYPGSDLAKEPNKPECSKSPTHVHFWKWVDTSVGAGYKCFFCGKTCPE